MNRDRWDRLPLVSLCASSDDIRCGPFGTQLSKDEFREKGVPLWGIKQVNAAFTLPTKEFLEPRTANRLQQYNLKAGDIVMTRKGTVGNCAVYPRDFAEGIMHSDLLRLRVDTSRCDTSFLVHQLHHSPDVERQLALISGGAVMPGINVGRLKQLEVIAPPLSEQKRIAEILDQAEALRAKRRAALAQLDTLTQSIFLDLFGDPKSNPNGWDEKPMADLFSTSPIFGSMIPPVSEKRGWLSLRVANIQNWKLDLSDEKFIDLPAESVARHSVRDGDLLLARAIASQEHLGKCVIANPNGRQWAFDSHLMRLRFNFERAIPEFVRQLFMTPGGRSRFLKASRKSTVQFNINTKEISALHIPVPPLNLQHEFARRAAAVEKLKTAHRQSLTELDALFASLQHRAFGGGL